MTDTLTKPNWMTLTEVAREQTFVVDGRGHDTWRLENVALPQGLAATQFVMNLRRGHDILERDIDDDLTERLLETWRENEPLAEPIPLYVSRHDGCTYCTAHDYLTDGFKIFAAEPCPYPEGYVLKVELEVPSGQLIIGNDFRQEFAVKDDDFYVNELSEIKRCVETYASEAKMLHFFVGNSCPGVFRTGKDQFAIGCLADEEHEDFVNEVASVCTDLWWVSIVDKDEADRRGLQYNTGHWVENDPVEVTPGTYVLTYYVLQKGFDRDAYPVLFADLKLKEAT